MIIVEMLGQFGVLFVMGMIISGAIFGYYFIWKEHHDNT
jgi:hypothetical protein